LKSILLFILTISFLSSAFAEDKLSAFDRIISSNTINCAYYVWPPFISKDVNTGKLSGLSYDIMTALADSLSLKLNWSTEVNFDAMFEGYANGRYDMLCAPLFSTPARARASDFTDTFMYLPYYLYARADDKRFDNHYEKGNSSNVIYASLDGDMNAILGNEEFPNAKKYSIGQNASQTDPLMAIATRKADIATLEPVAAQNFLKANTDKLKRVLGPPVRISSVAYSIPIGEERLKSMLNIALRTLIETGKLDKILKNYPEYNSVILKMANSYEAKK
jgi:ABC-type amino acid transport substrate-binding protein